MRIVHVIDYFQPELGYQEYYLAREQLAMGHDVHVVCGDRYYPFPDYDRTIKPLLGERIRGAGRGEECGVPVWRLPVGFERGKRAMLRQLNVALDDLRPEVVHSHNIIKFHTFQVAARKKRFGYRLLVDEHAHGVSINQRWTGRLFYTGFRQTAARYLNQRVDVCVGITQETTDIIRAQYGLRNVPLHVVELGVDTELFHRDEMAGMRLRRRWGLSETDFLVIYTGKIIPSKAPHWLLEALVDTRANVKALFVGNVAECYRQKLETTVQKCGLQDRVHFHDAVKQAELPAYYSAADAGCWPRETSMAMLEAAACELPIVVVSVGVEARVAQGNGFTYDEGNIGQLSQRLAQLEADRGLARSMGQQGRDLVRSRFSWQRIASQFLELYEASRV